MRDKTWLHGAAALLRWSSLMGIVACGTVLVSRLRACGRAAWRRADGAGAPQPGLRSGAREAAKPCREGVRRQRHAAIPGGREDRVAPLSQSHGVITPRLMTRQSAGAPGARLGAPWGARGAAVGAGRGAWRHNVAIGCGRSPWPLASTALRSLGGVEGAGRGAPAVPDSGARSAPGAGGRGSPRAGDAGSRGATPARGRGGYMRRRRASSSGHGDPADDSGRQSSPPRPARRGADTWPWRREASSGRHRPSRGQGLPGAPGRSPPSLSRRAAPAAACRPQACPGLGDPSYGAPWRRPGGAPHSTGPARPGARPARARGSGERPQSSAARSRSARLPPCGSGHGNGLPRFEPRSAAPWCPRSAHRGGGAHPGRGGDWRRCTGE
jgi:hypothetical protein